jgi:NADH-quinone oxidoreductase subunit J
MLPQILFLVFGVITLGGGLMVVTRRNVFHAALFMILSFFGVAGLYVLLEAPFLAGAQLFIYVGGISILIIFAIMLTRDIMKPDQVGRNRQWIAAAIVVAALGVMLTWTVIGHDWVEKTPGAVPESSLVTLGQVLVDQSELALPFEVASVLLLVALIGAVTLAREQ